MEAFCMYILLLFLAIYTIKDYIHHKLHNLPPRPWLPPIPFIGHLYLLKQPLHRSLAALSAHHGPIQLLRFGSRPVLVVSSPSTAEECLTKNDIVFANRPRLLAGKYIGYNYTSMLFAPYGVHWRNLRRVSALELLSSQRIHEFEHIRVDEVLIMIRKIYRLSFLHATKPKPEPAHHEPETESFLHATEPEPESFLLATKPEPEPADHHEPEIEYFLHATKPEPEPAHHEPEPEPAHREPELESFLHATEPEPAHHEPETESFLHATEPEPEPELEPAHHEPEPESFLHATDHVQIEVKPMLVDLTLNEMMRMISGKRYYYDRNDVLTEEEKEKAHRFQEIVTEIIQVAGATDFGDYLPVLRWFGMSKLEKRLISLQAKRDRFMWELVEELKGSIRVCGDGKKKSNMIEVLLSLQKTQPECYTDEMIRSIMLVMLGGGTHTSICTLEWAMSLLLNNPRVLKKVQTEIDNNVGHERLVQESDMPNLPYLGCIIKETMRMFPAGPLLPHESSKDCMVGGYHVPRGTMLLVNVWAIHNDPTIWKDPETFRPERFEDLECIKDDFKMLPFGFGRRGCPGEGMGMMMVWLTLGSLLQCFEWKRTSERKVDLREGKGIGMPKVINLVANCCPRSTMLNILSHL